MTWHGWSTTFGLHWLMLAVGIFRYGLPAQSNVHLRLQFLLGGEVPWLLGFKGPIVMAKTSKLLGISMLVL